MKRIKDVFTPNQAQNKPAFIKVEYKNLYQIDVKFGGQFADVIGLGADLYSALVEEIIERELMDSLIVNKCRVLEEFDLLLRNKALIDFKIDEKSNIDAYINGNSISLAAGYCRFLELVCKTYDISMYEYFDLIKGSYESWKNSDKKRIFDKAIIRG